MFVKDKQQTTVHSSKPTLEPTSESPLITIQHLVHPHPVPAVLLYQTSVFRECFELY